MRVVLLDLIRNLEPIERVVLFGFTGILLVILIIFIKSGVIVFQGKGLKIGVVNSNTRKDKRLKILKAQFDYLDAKAAHYERLIKQLYPGNHELIPEICPGPLDDWYVKYLVGVFKDTIIKWIVFEKLRDDKKYIQAKKKVIVAVIKTITNEALTVTNLLGNIIETQAEIVIKDLIEIEKGEKI